MTNIEIIKKVKIGLGIFYTSDKNIDAQVEQHINNGIHFFTKVKGIDITLMDSESGIMLLTIFVNDVWRENGKFEFSPATEMIFNSLMDATRGIAYANKTNN